MDTTTPFPAQPEDIERSMLNIGCEVWWSPADSAYVAVNLDFAPFIHADPRSAQAALDGLEAAVRANLLAAQLIPLSEPA